MVMPGGLTGRQLGERLLAEVPDLAVIYTSGYSPGMAERDLALPQDSTFVPKPYGPAKLLRAVRECLDNHRSGSSALTVET
jgi:FixJ family two-component response regulator